ncbi:MAG: DedA family protein [Salinisphaera sp.]|nr:DedA family protein [Salinisphaera sp.]
MSAFIIHTIEASGYFGIMLLMLLENIFPPIPSELIVPFAGYVAARGDLWFPGVIAAATLGSVLGALPWYALGLWFSEARLKRLADRFGRWLAVTYDDVETASCWFRRYDAAAVFFGRMIPTVRTLISLPAGSVRMSMPLFLLLTALGSALWVAMLASAGLLLEAHYDKVGHFVEPVTKAVIAIVVLAYVYRLVRFHRRRRQS